MKKINNNIIFTILITFSAFSFSQDYDEGFLKSLPEDVKTKLIEANTDKKEKEETQYRRPSTFIEKPFEEESDRFGIGIFSMMQTTLMPFNEPNFDGSYILDYGDVLQLQLVGQKSSISTLDIKRDGSINLEEIGKIFLSGLSLDNASDLIKAKVNTAYIGVESFVSLVNVRDIQVIVAGNVFNPGPYTLNGNSNIFHALNVSGGPSESGSFRSINLVRNNEIIQTIDLYDTFVRGKSSFNTRLRSGDLIFVNPVTNLVSIEGAVKRPGVFELLDEEELSVLIEFSNGITNKADKSDIKLFRIAEGNVIEINIEDIKDLNNLVSFDNDKLVIREYPFRSVTINGAVKKPGKYLINQGDGILQLVNRAGGYTDNAYPFGGVLENESTRLINEMAITELHQSFVQAMRSNLMSTSLEEGSGQDSIMGLMADLESTPVSGRVSAEFDLEMLENDESKDIKLQDGDIITIPEFLDHVYIFGEVSSQGTVRYSSDMDLKYYLDQKGGYNDYADQNAVFILHANGETVRAGSKNLFVNSKQYNIYPGSVIFVPRKSTNAFVATQSAQAYAAILGNIGVSLASISVLKE